MERRWGGGREEEEEEEGSDEVSAQFGISRERQTKWRFFLMMFMMMSSESGYKFRSETNR